MCLGEELPLLEWIISDTKDYQLNKLNVWLK